MRRLVNGIPLYTARPGRGVQKPRSWSPAHSARYMWRVGQWLVTVIWEKRVGFFPTSAWREGSGTPGEIINYPNCEVKRMKKPVRPEPAAMPDVLPLYECRILKKFPLLTRFLTDRWYEDGSPRTPGSMWLDSDQTSFTIMLKEKTTFMQARFRAATMDDVYAAVEMFLGLDAPPWELDEYALSRAPKKGKK